MYITESDRQVPVAIAVAPFRCLQLNLLRHRVFGGSAFLQVRWKWSQLMQTMKLTNRHVARILCQWNMKWDLVVRHFLHLACQISS